MKIFDECKTNTDQGNIGLAKAIYELQVLGYRISVPLTENQNYDLICDKDNILYRVQIKTTKQLSPNNTYKVNLRTLGGNQSFNTIKKRNIGDYDLLYVLTNDNESYLIPDNAFKCLNCLTINNSLLQYKLDI